jgi:hypothetical protein
LEVSYTLNFNIGLNPPQSREAETLYKLAYECAHNHTTIQCRKCKACMYNIDQYGWDPYEAKLIKARALMDYQQNVAYEKHKRREYWKGEIVLAAVVIGFCLFTYI